MIDQTISFPQGSRFLVTGGAGFIGSNLCEAILSLGYSVRCFDNLSTGDLRNLICLQGNPNYTFVKGDIRNFDACLAACDGIDYILHHAAGASVPQSIEMPLFYEEVNITGSLNMMEAAKQKAVKKFIYASSSAVYGDGEGLPKREGEEGKPLSPYALTKKVNEEYGQLYSSLYNLPCIGLRYFNVFGPRQNPQGAYAAVIPNWIELLLQNKRPIIYGDGLQTRDFTYVDDVISANLLACLAPDEASGEAFNIAAGGQESLLDLYQAICKALKVNVKAIFNAERAGDIKHSTADISKARKMLAYKPAFNFEKGLALAVDWYKSQS